MKLKLCFEAYLLALIVLINTHRGDAKTKSSMVAGFFVCICHTELVFKIFL